MKTTSISAVGLALLVAGICACGGGGGGGDSPGTSPTAAATMEAELKANMVKTLPLLAPIEASLIYVLNPGTILAQGVTLTPDTTPGAAPNSFTFSGPYDGNGDGLQETTMSGSATLASNPAFGWSGLNGSATVNVSIPVVGHLYTSTIAFTVNSADQRLSGSGTFTNPINGNVTTMSVPAGTPLIVKPATGAPDAVANACGYSLDGRLRLTVAGSTGTLASDWNFSPASPTATVTGTTFTDPGGLATPLPDSTADLRCGSTGTVNDWAGTYTQDYACLPNETGKATLTLTASGANTVAITDEDPPGSGNINTYSATMVSGNPYALRGFFIAGPVGSRYREDFTWTRNKNGTGFTQFSIFTFFEGPNTGSGGICAATARR